MEILKQSLSETKKGRGTQTPVEEETVTAESSRSSKPPKLRKVK
jgi:hypothetical protein